MAEQATDSQNYTLGRGELHFARFINSTTKLAGPFRYIGNTPEFSLTISQENLDHFSSDHGIREKDESIALQVDRTGSFTTDNVQKENVSLFFFGESLEVVDAGATVLESFVGEQVAQGTYIQLGISASRPTGAKGIAGGPDDSNSAGVAFTVAASGSNSVGGTYVEGTDYSVDYELGRVYIIPGGAIDDGDSIDVDYTIKASSFDRVISGSAPVEGAMQFISFNPVGLQQDFFFPWVKISPNGDYNLKGDDWQVIPYNIEILKRSDREAIYRDGRPVFA